MYFLVYIFIWIYKIIIEGARQTDTRDNNMRKTLSPNLCLKCSENYIRVCDFFFYAFVLFISPLVQTDWLSGGGMYTIIALVIEQFLLFFDIYICVSSRIIQSLRKKKKSNEFRIYSIDVFWITHSATTIYFTGSENIHVRRCFWTIGNKTRGKCVPTYTDDRNVTRTWCSRYSVYTL